MRRQRLDPRIGGKGSRLSSRIGAVAGCVTGGWLVAAGAGTFAAVVRHSVNSSHASTPDAAWIVVPVSGTAGVAAFVGGGILLKSIRRMWHEQPYNYMAVEVVALITAAVSLIGVAVIGDEWFAVLPVASWTLFSCTIKRAGAPKRGITPEC